MRVKRCNVDSLNLSDNHMEAIFIHNEDYSMQIVKSKTVFEPKVWSETFGKSLKQNIVEAKIIHTYRGVTLPLKTFASSPLSQTLEFAGLHGYNELNSISHIFPLRCLVPYTGYAVLAEIHNVH
mgnify:CR=1 FL=1